MSARHLRRTTTWTALPAVLALLLTGCTVGEEESTPAVQERRPVGEVEGVVEYDVTDNTHEDGEVEYDQAPPAGGRHSAVWAPCGVSGEPLVDEEAVHTLEHGVVWVTYRPELPEEDVTALEGLYDTWERVMVSPHPEQDSPVTLTAWGRQLSLESALDPRVEGFLEAYLDSENAPEPGASCEELPDQLPAPGRDEPAIEL